ncbi:MAG: tRNA adenosine(34) deaminase TadA [Actinomycetaceae bacterium]|nr:tRNA adenosine(34) deaminase TadA [Actinomycetaceae bacterium]
MSNHPLPKRVELHGTHNLRERLERAAMEVEVQPERNRGRRPPSPSQMREIYESAMSRALFLANRAREAGDVPVGAVVIDDWGTILGEGWNTREANFDPAGHAEIMALREAAAARRTWRLDDLTLVVTLEPCTMCAGAVVNARIKRLVMGAWDEKAGAAGSIRDVVRDSRLNHQAEVIAGVLQTECEIQLRGFFSARRSM